jgi:hypothetical protein
MREDPAPAGGLEYDEISFVNADAAMHPPGAFDGDLAAIKTAALNGQLGTVDAQRQPFCAAPAMSSGYEDQFHKLAIEWGREKLRKWRDALDAPSLSLLDRRELEKDISYMERLVARLEKGAA